MFGSNAARLAAAASICFAFGTPAFAAQAQNAGGAQSLSASAANNEAGSANVNSTSGNPQQAGNSQPAGHAGTQTANAGNGGQCMQNVRSFENKMQQDGYWLNGYSGMGYAFVPAAPAVPTAGAARNNNGNNGSGNANGNGNANAAGPWGNVRWDTRPGFELRTLAGAADVLARQGDQQICEHVLQAAQTIYHRYTADLAKAGVNGPGVTNWRRQQIAHAVPVTQMQENFRLQDITGTDVRNDKDNLLGSVNDVVLDPHSGKIAYVIVNYGGGIFGIGSSNTAVPWQDFAATPGLNTLVLNTTEQVLKDAPQVNPNQFANGPTGGKIDQRLDAYWSKHLNG